MDEINNNTPAMESDSSIPDDANPSDYVYAPIPVHPLVAAFLPVLLFAMGLGVGYLIWGNTSTVAQSQSDTQISQSNQDNQSTAVQVDFPESYTIPVSFGDLGPQLLESGAIDYDKFVQVYEKAGQPLNEAQLAILNENTNSQIEFNAENSYFLLNFFWAVGLVNENALLEEGPMMDYITNQAGGQIESLASTGGWTIGTKSAADLYSSTPIVTLTPEQQARVKEVAEGVFRPCCNNSTAFPDCNHGMAMLGLLELMASQDATTDEMFQAAKYVNAFWFPQQMYELALYFQTTHNIGFEDIDARQMVSADYSSISGYRQVQQTLQNSGQLQIPQRGNSCGV